MWEKKISSCVVEFTVGERCRDMKILNKKHFVPSIIFTLLLLLSFGMAKAASDDTSRDHPLYPFVNDNQCESGLVKFQNTEGEAGVQKSPRSAEGSSGGFAAFRKKYQLRAGFLPGMSFAVGELGGLLKMGLSTQIMGDLAIPISFLNTKGLIFRSGLLIGYTPHSSASSEYDAKINLLPLLPYAEVSYPLDFGLKPFARLGMGGTFSSLKDKSQSPGASDESSLDATLAFGAGASYQHTAIPRVEFLLSLGYMLLFEQVNGSFLTLSIGACYQLY